MFKKTLATALLVCAIPALAIASTSWFLSTQAGDAGGTIDSRNMTGQTSANGALFKSYTSSAAIPVTVTAAPGYTIKSIVVNGTTGGITPVTGSYTGTALDAVPAGTTIKAPHSPYQVTITGSYSDKSLTALFTPTTYTVTAHISGGSVSPAKIGNINSGTILTSPVMFTFSPAAGYQINGITGLPSGITSVPPVTALSPAAANQKVTVTIPTTFKFTGSFDLSATSVNTTPSIPAILPKTVLPGATVTLTAAPANVVSTAYSWSYVSGPANTVVPVSTIVGKDTKVTMVVAPGPVLQGVTGNLISAPATPVFINAAAQVSFTAPSNTGQYKFQFQVQNGLDANNKPKYLTTLATVNVIASTAAASNQCQFCHTANGVADPTIGAQWAAASHAKSLGSSCAACHVGTDTGGHPGTLSAATVSTKTFTTVTSAIATDHLGAPLAKGAVFCTKCHYQNSPYGDTSYEYAASGHAANAHGPTCASCHTSVHNPDQAYSACITCHNGSHSTSFADPTLGNVVHFASVTTNTKAFANDAAAFVGNKLRPRNNCSVCHFTIDPHGIGATTTTTFTQNSAELVAWQNSAHGTLTGNFTSKLDDHMFNISDRKAGTSAAHTTTTVNEANTVSYSCVRCHTSNGIAQFVTADAKHAVFTNISAVDIQAGFGVQADSSPLTCSGCHVPDALGATTSALRVVPAAVGFYNVSTAAGKVVTNHTFADLGESNICVSCHAGVSGNGEAIKNVFITKNQDFTGKLINPHHGMGADAFNSYGLYEYGDYSAIKNDHMNVGTSAQGACVGCHYSNGHSLDLIDPVTLVATAPVCTSCHGASFNLTASRANYDASLVVLKNALVAAGLPTSRAGTASGEWGYSAALKAGNMGASMNYYVLYSQRLASNPSGGVDAAGYVHNPNYVKKAIFDSIDWVAHSGSLTGSINDVVAAQQLAGAITATQAAAVGTFTGTHPLIGSNACSACHSAPNSANEGASCVTCHSIGQQVAGFVADNNGVRAILGQNSEFAKKSHHIFNGVGIAPTDAQCVACHLEGKVSGTAITVDNSYHMHDAKIHLRNAHTDADFSWDPAAATSTDHTNMDNFCMSCHSASGATSSMSGQIQAYLNAYPAFTGAPAASATNPFGDLVSNSYDKQSRVTVVDVADQFNTDNYSHHAVKGKRYTTRTSTVAVAAWVAYSTAGGHSTDVTVPGSPRFNASTQKTLYDGGLLGNNGTAGTKYTPLDTAKAGATIGDDSQIHCGDCHTVGQWAKNVSTNADGTKAPAAIGAHGSVNEYMLRNTKGTDALNGLGTFICYNCHNDKAGANTSGGYYAGAYWNNATGKWVKASGSLHLSLSGGGSSVQYGGGSNCIQNSAGLAFTGYTSAIHNNISWKSSWATPATSTTLLLGSNGAPWDEGLGIVGNQGNSIAAGTTTAPFNNPYLVIKLQSVLNGSQTVFFDASGNFAGIYSSFAAVPNPSSLTTTAGMSTQLAGAPAINSFTSGNGNPSNKPTGTGVAGTPGNGTGGGAAVGNPLGVDLVFDADGTVIDPSFFAGTGRNNLVGGNIFGNGCLNCHNVGRTGFGGIHGGKNTYTTGFSTSNHGVPGQAAPEDTQSTYRFMPGLGNYGYIPAGAGKEPGKYTTDATGVATLVEEPSIAKPGKAGWEAWNGVGTSAAGGCYTNDYAKQNAGWSGCNHHGNGGVNDGGPGGTQPLGFGAGEPPTKTQANGQVGRTLNY